MPSRKPTLALETPVSASFPAEALLSAASVRTPQSAITPSRHDLLSSAGLPSAGLSSAGLFSPLISIKTEEGLVKTPITPPMAYMDFLKMAGSGPSPGAANTMATPTTATTPATAVSEATPAVTVNETTTAAVPATPKDKSAVDSKEPESTRPGAEDTTKPVSPSVSAASSGSDGESNATGAEDKETDSGPSSATSNMTECSCDCERVHKSPRVTKINTSLPCSPFSAHPTSAPAVGRTTFSNLNIPESPATAGRTSSPARSPFSARSVASPFDWEAALKARYSEVKTAHSHKCSKSTSSRTSVRHVREVITRTVTYTPRMEPPPKGKKRKVGCDGATCS